MSEPEEVDFPDDLDRLPNGWEYQSLVGLVDDQRGACHPPDKQEKATQTVLQQAELPCRAWGN